MTSTSSPSLDASEGGTRYIAVKEMPQLPPYSPGNACSEVVLHGQQLPLAALCRVLTIRGHPASQKNENEHGLAPFFPSHD